MLLSGITKYSSFEPIIFSLTAAHTSWTQFQFHNLSQVLITVQRDALGVV